MHWISFFRGTFRSSVISIPPSCIHWNQRVLTTGLIVFLMISTDTIIRGHQLWGFFKSLKYIESPGWWLYLDVKPGETRWLPPSGSPEMALDGSLRWVFPTSQVVAKADVPPLAVIVPRQSKMPRLQPRNAFHGHPQIAGISNMFIHRN